ncbi:MAG: carbon-nitrogen family hydrolase [Syntrophobacterales bacterium]|nr:carbon-nitrogen family hydrolase [Syntrophobacterales bacterium]
MNSLSIIAFQYSIAEGNIETNIEKVDTLGKCLNPSDPKVVILPEMWASGFDYKRLREHALNGWKIRDQMARWASEWNAIIIGSIADLTETSHIVNRAYVIDPSGNILGYYDKIHLFSPHGEHLHFARGSRLLIAETPLGRVGVIICYDLRFPEICRIMAIEGAELLCVPALWPSVRVDHWRLLLRARAVENQMFVVGCNGCGEIGNISYPGASSIISPWGEILKEGKETEEIIATRINMGDVERVRSTIPCLADRIDPSTLKVVRCMCEKFC